MIRKTAIAFYFLTEFAITVYLLMFGINYYILPAEERFWQPVHETLKPSGYTGHGLGIAGSLLVTVGVIIYSMRKRLRFFRFGRLGDWLEFHIFLCTLGPILILFHTAFKFGGIIAVSFWSMVIVVLSGIIGRYIYIQIPRTIRGDEMTLKELNHANEELSLRLKERFNISDDMLQEISAHHETLTQKVSLINDVKNFIADYSASHRTFKNMEKRLIGTEQKKRVSQDEIRTLRRLLHSKIVLSRRIKTYQIIQRMFRYWHAAHLPFAVIMFVIMIIHIATAWIFGYRWVF